MSAQSFETESLGAKKPASLAWTRVRNLASNRRLRNWLTQPLLHFIVAGAAIFIASEVVEHQTTRYRIVFGPEHIARISATYEQQYGAPPTAAQLDTLKNNWLREEVLYREALALGLDQGDEIVRRRLVQKFEFLQQDLQALQPPTQEELQAFYAANAPLYVEPAQRGFRHVYFSPDRGGDAVARGRAEAALAQLATGRDVAGDNFSGPTSIAAIDQQGVVRVFGGRGFAANLFAAPLDVWSGPFRSGLGWHLTLVQAESPPVQPAFADIAARLQDDWVAARRSDANAAAFASVKDRYAVVDQTGAP